MKAVVSRLLFWFLLVLGSGCASGDLLRSRWAMDDPVYAAKYGDGAERYDVPGKVKQAMDARHLAGHHGCYAGAAYQADPSAAAAEIGLFMHPANWFTARAGLMGLAAEDSGLYGGFNFGVRSQSPSRVAPFAGLGLFTGWSPSSEIADLDGLDNDDDFLIDEPGEEATIYNSHMVVYPEVGLHAWLTQHLRLTASASYHVTTEGRDYDHWMFGVSLSVLSPQSIGFLDAYDRGW